MASIETVDAAGFPTVSEINQPLQLPASAAQNRYQMAWDSEMDHGQGRKLYERTVAFLLSWTNSDLITGKEVSNLKRVLQDDYKFDVEEVLLDKNQSPKKKLNLDLATFVHKYDHKNTLIILYYAGHGWNSKNEMGEEDFFLIERVTEEAWDDKDNKIGYYAAERILDGADGDVLGIFDCCNAGKLCQSRSPARFEYLGACASDQTTLPPGDSSFTSALIWALKALKLHGAFSTSALRAKIKEAPKFPKAQVPHLGHRLGPVTDHIMISPGAHDIAPGQYSNELQSPDRPVCDFLEIRIHVHEMTEDVIKAWARAMNSHRTDKRLEVERIDFRGTNLSRYALLWLGNRARGSTADRVGQSETTGPLSVQVPPRENSSTLLPVQSVNEDGPLTPNSCPGETQLIRDNVSFSPDDCNTTQENKTRIKRKADEEVEKGQRKIKKPICGRRITKKR